MIWKTQMLAGELMHNTYTHTRETETSLTERLNVVPCRPCESAAYVVKFTVGHFLRS